jgi:hypothetical protein
MNRRILFLILICLFAPTVSHAQDSQRETLVLEMWKCQWDKVGVLAQVADSLQVPIAQELIDEGKLLSFGMLAHDFADEWNVVYYTRAVDKAAFFSALSEMNSRLYERHPDVNPWSDLCTEHKDNIYTVRAATP